MNRAKAEVRLTLRRTTWPDGVNLLISSLHIFQWHGKGVDLTAKLQPLVVSTNEIWVGIGLMLMWWVVVEVRLTWRRSTWPDGVALTSALRPGTSPHLRSAGAVTPTTFNDELAHLDHARQ